MAGMAGLEPTTPESKSDVLPLHHTPSFGGVEDGNRTHRLQGLSLLRLPIAPLRHNSVYKAHKIDSKSISF